MNADLLDVVATTLEVASTATLVSALPCIAIAYLLARRDFPGKGAISAVVSMPLVLPPTVIGLGFLHLFATDGPLGQRALGVDLDVVLGFRGAVLAAAAMSVPLFVRTARVAFEEVDPALEQMARTLGHGPIETFFRFTIPMARRGLIAALILGFTRALGEYGATVTLAGSIPGRTRTLASAITSADQAGQDAEAKLLAGVAIALGFVAVFASEKLSRLATTRVRA